MADKIKFSKTIRNLVFWFGKKIYPIDNYKVIATREKYAKSIERFLKFHKKRNIRIEKGISYDCYEIAIITWKDKV